jgi:hypothetical protein
MSGMFSYCYRLISIPNFSTAAITKNTGTDFADFLLNCINISRCQMVFARTISLSGCLLKKQEIIEVFTNLVDRTGTTSATITISNNPGSRHLSSSDRLIATNKNWTIFG